MIPFKMIPGASIPVAVDLTGIELRGAIFLLAQGMTDETQPKPDLATALVPVEGVGTSP